MIITSRTPRLDLHGEIGSMVPTLVNDFIRYHYLLYDEVVIIIHGISGHIVKETLYDTLNSNLYVKSFKLDNENPGQTIIEINKRNK